MRMVRGTAVASLPLLALFVLASTAVASIPSSLKSSCTPRAPHAGFSYQFCDDGLPPTGGLSPNTSGTSAVKVPARYQADENGDDWTGLPPKDADADSMPGADNQGFISLDVDISVPTVPAPAGGYPLIAMMHGCCAGDKTGWEATSFDAGGERWHYNNAWFASRGYVVVNYTARGFVNGENNGNLGSTGETQLDSRRFEINDFQHLAGLVADDPFFNVDPQKILATGGSYGGGFSWLALTDPIWTSPGGASMKLAAVAPKYGWTDLIYSLLPSGRHFQTRNRMPDGEGLASAQPPGIPKKSIVSGLYASGKTGIPPGSAHTTFPPYIDDALACLSSTDPFETNPICSTPLNTTLPSFLSDRSAYYQDQFFSNVFADPGYRIPVFNAATFTDPLFTPVENLRISNRLESIVPDYPIQQYFGDYQHFVQNKAKEWGDICGSNRHVCTFADYPGGDLDATPTDLQRTGVTTRLNRFIDHYAGPPGNPSEPEPDSDVTASLQICPKNAGSQPADEPGPTFNAGRFEDLAQNVLRLQMTGTQATVNNAEPNPHAVSADPVANLASNGGRCPVESGPAGPGVATYQSAPLASQATMIGATAVSIDYSATDTTGNFQLNSRLYDVFPDGDAVMVDRGVRRVTDPSGTVTYQLHGNGWRFAAGHRIRIEIAQDDDPFLKASSVSSAATITKVKLEIPIRENLDAFPRPGGGTPLRVPLVPAYAECTSASQNSNHVAPLALDSCSPAGRESSLLTTSNIGTGSGLARLEVVVGSPGTEADEADLRIDAAATDVRTESDGSDYAGKAILTTLLRITDRANGFFATEAATVRDAELSIPVDCVATPASPAGGTCSVDTTADTLLPGFAREGKRTVISAFSVKLEDAGADGSVGSPASCPPTCGTGDEGTFLRQGVFTP
jgi:hypothetical protein